ncbi:DUF4174 domain-containing protein [Pararhizobium sp.]|uniref:DUF4174 domain-containing protein n=1 Tax=Pararhizobium sp. TaxID=1977563 RepID=UPI00271A8AD6|nr:DUF4174 domain-containing protein [Pararhizobium sp.]MDO9417056.1 DUF4174 domain-containing protein [Pararhizobium sp.]
MNLSSIVFGTASTGVSGVPQCCETGLKQFHWKKRVLVIFADKGNAETARQKNMLATAREGLAERDVVVLLAKGQTVTPIFGEAEPLDYNLMRVRLSGPDTERFMAVLLGKDGTVKLREREAVTPAELFALIDAMPMRQVEQQG